jgi:hypothetical protein
MAAGARPKMSATICAVGEAHFFDPVHIEGVDKAGDPLRPLRFR